MANFIILELAPGKQKVPSYAPYIVPDLTDPPWPFPTADHTASNLRRRALRQSAKAAEHLQLPLHGWILYRTRLILIDDVCGAWRTFGGLAAHLNHMSVALHLSTAESITTAMIYDQLLSSQLEELARSPDELVSDPRITMRFFPMNNSVSIYKLRRSRPRLQLSRR